MKSAILSGAGSSVPAGFPPTRPHPHDPDAKIAKMKDGRTHLAHTAEHAVDLRTGAIVGVTVQDASAGDTTTLAETLNTAAEQVEAVGARGIVEFVADKGITAMRRWSGLRSAAYPATSRSRIAADGGGRARPRHGTRCMPRERSVSAQPRCPFRANAVGTRSDSRRRLEHRVGRCSTGTGTGN